MRNDKLNLLVEIDDSSGFCFGVVKAINKAEASLEKGEPVYSVGQIVHNDEESERLRNKGLVTIPHDQLHEIKNKRVLFRAHGEPPESYKVADQNQCEIIDASCPIILRLQERVKKAYRENENILIYGKEDHPEIIALVGNTDGHARVFGSVEDLEKMELPQKATLYSQTTKSLEGFRQAVTYLRNKGVDLKVHDTVCRQVHNREAEIATFCEHHDKVIFIAGKNSSNGKVLFNVCHKNNTNAIFVSSVEDIKKEWFLPNEKVGVCGATSTPAWQMQAVKERLKQW